MGNCIDPGTPDQEPLLPAPATRDRIKTNPTLMRPSFGAPEGKDWYHGQLTDREAEMKMQDNARGIYGAFLVYDDPQRHDGYKILAHKDGVLHKFIIRRRQDNLKFELLGGQDGKCFPKVKNLIHHHRGLDGVPLKLPGGDTLVLSKEFKWL